MLFLPFHLPFLVFPLVLLLVFCLAKGSCRRGGAPIGLILLVVLGGFLMIGLRMSRIRSDFGGVPAIVRVSPARVQVATPAARASTGPSSQTSKLWIDDWTAFTNSSRFSGFRVESSDTCATEAESLNEAIQAAARDLYTVVSTRPEVQSRTMIPNQSNLLMQQVTSAVVSQEVVAEQFIRTTEKSYGTLWKTFLLIDTSPSKINPLVRRINQQVSATQKRTLTTAGSIAATMLVVLLLYAFLNTVTKGYFIWRLRAAVILVLIAGVLVFCSIV